VKNDEKKLKKASEMSKIHKSVYHWNYSKLKVIINCDWDYLIADNSWTSKISKLTNNN